MLTTPIRILASVAAFLFSVFGLNPLLVQAAEIEIDFNRDIRPILSDRCFHCHGPDETHREAELRFDVEDSAKKDRDGYAAIVPGSARKSEAFQRITSDDADLKMPPHDTAEPLTQKEVELIRIWIEQGAKYEQHWAYRPLKRPDVPAVQMSNWPVNAIDRFILARLESKKILPSPAADATTLIRRLSFDLTGLPPSYADVEMYRQSPTSETYEKLVDQYLASHHFGERLAVYWLDLVRYADTVGYHGDQDHSISPYRDYVIRAFNGNMPFDQFTIEQLAGDLLPDPTKWQKVATGYNRLLQTTHEGGAQDKEYLAKYAADRVRNVSGVWLGATMGCAECHNHKFDPYTMEDFYSMQSFFADIQEQGAYNAPNSLPTRRSPEMLVVPDELQPRLDVVEESLKEFASRMPSFRSPVRAAMLVQLKEEANSIRSQGRLSMVTVSVTPRPIRILARGDWMDTSGKVVSPSVPKFLPQLSTKDRATRLDLAKWIADESNPLTARVFVNRLWKLYFGKGLSSRLEDLGAQGSPPILPQLLDWLAVEFRDSDWDTKRTIKTIVMSRTYQQASRPRADLAERDPSNKLYARQSSFRLDAEFIRDNALKVSGLLAEKVGGKPAKPYQPAGYYQHLNFPQRTYKPDANANQYRRGVYMHWQRMFLHPMLKAFDAPTREECTAERPVSNTPLAALVLLNDPTYVEASRAFAERMLIEGGKSDTDRIVWSWKTVLSRDPNLQECELLAAVLQQERESFANNPEQATKFLSVGLRPLPDELNASELAAWTSVARVILNLNETITRN